MKITFIGTLPPIKALSPYCYHLAEALSKNIDLEFINFKYLLPEFLYSGGTKEKRSYYSKKLKSIDIISWYNPLTWVKAGRFATGDIVHIQHWQWYATFMYCFIVPILKWRKKKILLSIHNITPHDPDKYLVKIDKILNRFLFHFADCFIVHNNRNKEKFEKIYKIKNKKIFVIGVGANKPQIMRNITKEKARDKLNIPQNKKVILFFGYIWEYKGIDILLYSLEEIIDNVNEVLLLIIGQTITDWKKYEKIIKNKNLDRFVKINLKYIPEPDIELYFSASDLVVLPYINPFETHGGLGALTVAMNKALVVSDIGGLPEYVKDERAIAISGDYKDLAKKIIKILNDKKLQNKLEKDSREISKEISWESIAEKTIEVYQDLINTD